MLRFIIAHIFASNIWTMQIKNITKSISYKNNQISKVSNCYFLGIKKDVALKTNIHVWFYHCGCEEVISSGQILQTQRFAQWIGEGNRMIIFPQLECVSSLLISLHHKIRTIVDLHFDRDPIYYHNTLAIILLFLLPFVQDLKLKRCKSI